MGFFTLLYYLNLGKNPPLMVNKQHCVKLQYANLTQWAFLHCCITLILKKNPPLMVNKQQLKFPLIQY